MLLDINQILSILPHRYPFLLVDKVIEISEKKIISQKFVTINEPFFAGHFPAAPIMPGVLQIEAIAQTAAILMLKDVPQQEKDKFIFALGAVRDMRFLKPVFPGDVLNIEVELIKKISTGAIASGVITRNNELVAKGELLFGIVKKT